MVEMSTTEEVVGLLSQGQDGRGLQHLQFLCENPEELCSAPGALEGVVKYTHRHMQQANVVAQACTVFNAVSAAREHRPAVARTGGVQVLLRALYTHESDKEVVEEATAALRTVAGCTESRELLAKLGGIALILQLMQIHWGSSPIVDHCSYTIWGLSVLSENQRILAKLEAIELLVRALQEYESVPSIVENCCGALRNIARSGNDLRNEVINSGGVLAPLMALSQHPTSPRIAEQAFALLCTLAGSEGQSADHLKAVVAPYVLPALKLAMFSPRAVEQGCAVLWCIAAVAAVELANGGAIAILVQALKHHARVASVVEKACGALTNISAVAVSRQKMATTPHLVDWLLFSLRSHVDHEGVVLQVCRALSNLSLDVEARRTIKQLQGLSPLLASLSIHKSHAGIVEHACRLVARLALPTISAEDLPEKDVDLLLEILEHVAQHIALSSPRVMEHVCMVIRNVLPSLPSPRSISPQMISAVIEWMKLSGQRKEDIVQACAALRVLLHLREEGYRIAEKEDARGWLEGLDRQELKEHELVEVEALLDDMSWRARTARK